MWCTPPLATRVSVRTVNGTLSTPESQMSPSASPAAAQIEPLQRDACLRLLADHDLGRVAISTPSGPPSIRPVNYVFDAPSQSVVMRTAPGSKLGMLLAAGEATFEIDGIDRATRTGWSVIVSGVAEAITAPAEIARLAGAGPDPWAPGERPHLVRIRAFTVSGRRLVGPQDR